MKKFIWLIAATLFAWPVMAGALQEDTPVQEEPAPPAAEAPATLEEEDVITIYGEGRMDKGLRAFLDGDYAQAEIEFEKNYKCSERQRMLLEMAIEQSRYGSNIGGAGFGDDGGIRIYNLQQNTESYFRGNPRNPDEIKDRTCENSDWQLYMIGLSQLQQGKYDEAKRSFYKVIRTSREPFLFDAHYRIALLEILDGNYDLAEERLKTLTVLQGRCVRQGERCEYRAEIDEIVAYLGPALERSRAGAAEG